MNKETISKIMLKLAILEKINVKVTLSKKNTEANAWVKKYLIPESLKPLKFSFKRKGMNPAVFNSKPTQHKIKDEEEATNNNLAPIIREKRKNEGVSRIREEIEIYSRGMSPKAYFSLPFLVKVRWPKS